MPLRQSQQTQVQCTASMGLTRQPSFARAALALCRQAVSCSSAYIHLLQPLRTGHPYKDELAPTSALQLQAPKQRSPAPYVSPALCYALRRLGSSGGALPCNLMRNWAAPLLFARSHSWLHVGIISENSLVITSALCRHLRTQRKPPRPRDRVCSRPADLL